MSIRIHNKICLLFWTEIKSKWPCTLGDFQPCCTNMQQNFHHVHGNSPAVYSVLSLSGSTGSGLIRHIRTADHVLDSAGIHIQTNLNSRIHPEQVTGGKQRSVKDRE